MAAQLHALLQLQLVVDAFEVTAASILTSAKFILLGDTKTLMKGFTIEIVTVRS
jgi:hypothetical protein